MTTKTKKASKTTRGLKTMRPKAGREHDVRGGAAKDGTSNTLMVGELYCPSDPSIQSKR